MMKLIVGLFLLAFAADMVYGEMKCNLANPEMPTEWIDLNYTTSKCLVHMRDQIQKEIEASYTYLAMGAHFSRDTVNRPGFAELFFSSAKEEREHAQKLIEYLSMRGQLTTDITNLITVPTVKQHDWLDGTAALKDALNLEIEVTESIRKVINACERQYNYYHLVDYLTGVFLEEQLKGQRELAGKLSTLKKMMTNHGPLGEFLFDKNL